jgi:hypothetical protein
MASAALPIPPRAHISATHAKNSESFEDDVAAIMG